MATFSPPEADPVAGAALSAEQAARAAADAAETSQRTAALADDLAQIQQEVTARAQAIADEATGRNAAINAAIAAITPASIGAVKASSTITAFTAPALNTPLQNGTGKTVIMAIRGAVISNPQQNGHMYFEVSPDGATGWIPWSYLACRNNQAAGTGGGTVQSGGPNIGIGAILWAVCPAGWWYRVRTSTIAGYSAPAYAYESSGAYFIGLGNTT